MDPLAHTLVGAALAETGLKRLSRYAVPTLLVGVNLPDIDVISQFWGEDASLWYRRGWSHGVLALVVLPLLLAASVHGWHWWRGQYQTVKQNYLPWLILLFSFLAVWSHPLLDWMNTYGVRLLMPFDGRWFYGDTLFIVDPWVWLLAAAGVVMARSKSWGALAGWVVLAGLTTVLVFTTGIVPLAVKVLWSLGLGTIVLLRWRRQTVAKQQLVAQLGVATLVLYICAAYGLARVTEARLAAQYPASTTVQANPLPGNPLAHRHVLVFDDRYQVITADGLVIEWPRRSASAVVERAMAQESVRGFVNWMRFPYWEVEEGANHWTVKFWDLRYQEPNKTSHSIGYVEVQLPK